MVYGHARLGMEVIVYSPLISALAEKLQYGLEPLPDLGDVELFEEFIVDGDEALAELRRLEASLKTVRNDPWAEEGRVIYEREVKFLNDCVNALQLWSEQGKNIAGDTRDSTDSAVEIMQKLKAANTEERIRKHYEEN